MDRSSARQTVVIALLADAAIVLAFVAIGRRSHDESGGAADFLDTLWPFGLALLLSWVGAQVWNDPTSLRRTGIPVWLGTALMAVLIRHAVDQGTATSFIVVTTAFLGVLMLGWRALLTRRRASP